LRRSIFGRRIDNYGIVDVAWSYAFGALAAFYALAATGWPVRRALIAALALTWSARLGTHLLVRVAGHHPVEDGRYLELRGKWAANFGPRMFRFFQFQAVSVVLLGAPFLLASLNPAARLHPLEIAGTVLWLLAISGEALADAQLAAFKRSGGGPGRVCDVGLWRYSRHPNYFSSGSSGWRFLCSPSRRPGARSPSSARRSCFTCCCGSPACR
jgi:steroid 5-alpha reductase family enzyme